MDTIAGTVAGRLWLWLKADAQAGGRDLVGQSSAAVMCGWHSLAAITTAGRWGATATPPHTNLAVSWTNR